MKFTAEVEMKFVPLTMRPKLGPPAVALVCNSEVIVGTGLFAARIGNVMELEVPPPTGGFPVPGFTTVICAEPAVAMSMAGIVTVNCWVLALKVTAAHMEFIPPGDARTQEPFQNTCEVEIKLVPIRLSTKSLPPAVAVSGKTTVRDGVGFRVTVLLLQLVSTTAMAASTTGAAQRERINPCLL